MRGGASGTRRPDRPIRGRAPPAPGKAAGRCGTGRSAMRTGVRPPQQKPLKLCLGAPAPQPGKARCCCWGAEAGFGPVGEDKGGRGRSSPGQRVAHGGAAPGARSAPLRRCQALPLLPPRNVGHISQSPLNCCKTNSGTFVGLARRRRSAAPRAPSPPAAPDTPKPQLMGEPGAGEGRARLGPSANLVCTLKAAI